MIVYEPNKNWFRDIWNLTTSWTIKKIFYGVMMSGAVSLVIVSIMYFTDYEPALHSGIFSLLGVVLRKEIVGNAGEQYPAAGHYARSWFAERGSGEP